MSEGIGCDVCAQVCPRLGIREFDLRDAVLPMEPGVYEGVFGRYRRIVAARCKDPEILARCQDGGVVTAMLAHGLREGIFDGAVRLGGRPRHARRAEAEGGHDGATRSIASASSWYTYCPNDLALEQTPRSTGLKKVAFVGVPCQITPVRKIQQADPAFLSETPAQEAEAHRAADEVPEGLRRDRRLHDRPPLHRGVHLRGPHGRRRSRSEMGIPLSDVKKFNVKGKVLIYKKDGEVVEMSLHKAQEYARPECHHCGDFTAELADISCGGVACMDWTITMLRIGAGRGALRRHGRGGAARGPLDGRVRAVDEGDAPAHEEAARARAGARRGGTHVTCALRGTRGSEPTPKSDARRVFPTFGRMASALRVMLQNPSHRSVRSAVRSIEDP